MKVYVSVNSGFTRPRQRAVKLRNDLDAAGITYVTDAGIADFHSLRHTFITNLVAGGVHPKVAQQLARHSSITLTMDRYSHLGLIDMTAGLAALPTIVAPDSQTMRATGTTDDAADFGCTNGCTRPAEITPFQPLSTVPMSSIGDSRQAQENPQFPAGNEGFSQGWPSGLEPPTSGSTIRRHIHQTNEAATSCEAAFAPWQFWWQ